MPLIQTRVVDAIGIVTLDHASRRNALSHAMVQEIVAALADFGARRLRAVLLCAARGSKVWSAGHDVDELPDSGRDPLGWDDPLRTLIREIETLPAPVIALVEGSVWGGACETVFACDLVLATPDATFALTPARLGVPYNVGGMLTLLNASNMRIAKEMAFTAQPIGSERAERLGMINQVVPADELESTGLALAQQIAADRSKRAAERVGDEGATAHPGRRAPDVAAGIRAHPGPAQAGLRQCRLPRGHSRFQGTAAARVPWGVRS